MDNQLDRLETKILEAIALIKDLRQKNQQLGEQCANLQGRLNDLAEEKDNVQRQLEAASEVVAMADGFETRRQLIEQKVSTLLDKLEAMG